MLRPANTGSHEARYAAPLSPMKHDYRRFGSSIPRFRCRNVPRWTCSFFILCILVAVAADQEPSYNGRLLSQWLGDMDLHSYWAGHVPEAIRAMGSNAVPALLNWIAYERPAPHQSSQAGETLRSDLPHYPLSPEERAERSEIAFECLGSVARPAIPELTRLARTSSDPRRADRCAASLTFIGPEAIPSLLSLATNAPPWTRYEAVDCLGRFVHDTEGEQTVPVLISCLGDSNTRWPIDGKAEDDLLSIGPVLVVPGLTNALQSPSAATRLGAAHCLLAFQDLGDSRLPREIPTVVPTLRTLMRDPDYQVRDIATNILRRMGGWEKVDDQWVRRQGTNNLNGITPDFFNNTPSR